jgi:eukaryotic-like serine/threonine-protein kinase
MNADDDEEVGLPPSAGTEPPRADVQRFAERIADDEPLERESTETASQLKGFLELESIVSGFRQAQQRFAQRAVAERVLFQFGPLDVLEKIGEGSQGEVYKAYDPLLEQYFALKLRRPEFGTLPHAFLQEARDLALFHHPNVVRVYGAANHCGRTGIWTEFVHGKPLEEAAASVRLRPEDVVEIGVKLCDALHALHVRGIVHGDIKPGNVMLEDSGRVVLVDLGAAQRFRDSAVSSIMLGTPQYLAPELLRGAASSPLSDVYALGVMMFRLAAREYPYPLVDPYADRGNQRKLAELVPNFPRVSANAIDRAVAVDPRARHRGMSTFATALRPTVLSSQSKLSLALSSAVLIAVLVIATMWLTHTNSDVVDTQVTLVRETAKEGREILQSGSVLNLGDELAIEFQSKYPAYVYIFGGDNGSKATVLFPIEGTFPVNPLTPGTVHHIPGSVGGQLLDWQVVSDAPSEEVVVLAATEPQPDLDREIASLEHASADAPPRLLQRSMNRLVPAPEMTTVGNPYLRELLSKARQSEANGKIHVWDFRLPHAPPLSR